MGLIPQSVKAVVSNIDVNKMSQQIAQGGASWLNEGEHDVKIIGVDLDKLREKGTFVIIYADSKGATHRDQLTITMRNRKTGEEELNWRFRDTLGALIPSVEAYEAFFGELMNDNAAVFGMLTDMYCRIVIARGVGNKYGPGSQQPDGGWIVRDTKTGDIAGGPAATLDEACHQAEARGFAKSFLNVSRIHPHAEAQTNLALFEQRMREFHTPKQAAPKVAVGNFYRPVAKAG